MSPPWSWEQRPGLRAQAQGVADTEERLERKRAAKRVAPERETELLLPLIAELPDRPRASRRRCSTSAAGSAPGSTRSPSAAWSTTGIEPGPTARAGAARVAHSLAEMVDLVAAYLADQALDRAARRRVAEDECGPLDGRSGERVGRLLLDAVTAPEGHRARV